MNFDHAMKLNNWVGARKQEIQMQQPTQQQLAGEATLQLGFKVSTSSISSALIHHGIKRKSRIEAEKDALRAEVERYRNLMLKVVTATQVPEWLRRELLDDDNLNEQIRDALCVKNAG